MDKLLELTDKCHAYCMDYLENSERFVHENRDVITDIVNVACATAMVGMISKAAVDIARAINEKER